MYLTPTIGHYGFLKTYRWVLCSFYWLGMKHDINKFVLEYDFFQWHKGELVENPRLLQHLPIPKCTWTDIPMDFVEGLPKSYEKPIIMVVVDRLSKYVHLCPLAHPYKDVTIAQFFLDNNFKLHGMPSTIVNDHDPTFTSKFWHDFFKPQGTKINMILAYHPQIDSQT